MLVAKSIHTGWHKEVKTLFLFIFANSKGGPTRIKIISLLRRGNLNANQLSAALGMDYKCICHHMGVLEKNNLAGKFGNGYGATFCIMPLLEKNMEVFNEILSTMSKNRIVKCADCNCLPTECKKSRSPRECIGCTCKYCCCWKFMHNS